MKTLSISKHQLLSYLLIHFSEHGKITSQANMCWLEEDLSSIVIYVNIGPLLESKH